MAVTVLVVWDVVALALVIVSVAVMLVAVLVTVCVVLVALIVITTVGFVVIEALSPDRDGTRLISSVIKALISDEEICPRAALLFSA